MTTNPLAAVTRAARARTRTVDGYRQAIINARASGATLQAIADAAGTDAPAVLRIIQRHGRTPQD